MRTMLILITLLLCLASSKADAQYYMPYGTYAPFGPTLNGGQYGYGFRPLSRYERVRRYQYRYNRPYYLGRDGKLYPMPVW